MAYLFNDTGKIVHNQPNFTLNGYIKDDGNYSITINKTGRFEYYIDFRLYFKSSGSSSYTLCSGPQNNGSLLACNIGDLGYGSGDVSKSASGKCNIATSTDGGTYYFATVCMVCSSGETDEDCYIYTITSSSNRRVISSNLGSYGATANCCCTLFPLTTIEQQFSEGYITLDYYRTNPTSAAAIVKVEYFGSATKYWAGTKKSASYSSSLQGKAKVKSPVTSINDWTNVPIGTAYSITTSSIYEPYTATARVVEELKAGTNHLMSATASLNAAEIPPAEFDGMSALISGTTISMKPSFTDPTHGAANTDPVEQANKDWTARLGKFKTSAADDAQGYARFQLLTNGITYTIIFSGILQEATNGSSASSDTIIDNVDISYDATTYKLALEEFEVKTNEFQAVAYQTVGQYGETDHAMTFLQKKSYKAFCRQRYGNNIIGGDVSKVDSGQTLVSASERGKTTINNATSVVTTKYLEPFTSYRLYGYLENCVDFVGDYDAVCYIDFTTLQVAVAGTFTAKVTGKTVTITPVIARWNGSESITITATLHGASGTPTKQVTITPWHNQEIVFTDLLNGSPYTITFTAHDNGILSASGSNITYNEIEIDPIEVVTYGISVTMGKLHSRYVQDIMVYYTDGEKASNLSQDMSKAGAVKWYVSDPSKVVGSGETQIVIPPNTVNCRRFNPNTFDTIAKMLEPDHTYKLTMYIDGVTYNGANDTMVYLTFKTLKSAYNLTARTCATGTTIGVIPQWTASNSPDNVTTVRITLQHPTGRLESKETTLSTDIWFTGLKRGETYPIYITASDTEGSTTDDFIKYASGFNGSGNEITYLLSFNEAAYQISTRSIKFKITCNRTRPAQQWNAINTAPSASAVQIQYYIHQPTLGDEGNYMNYSTNRLVSIGTDITYTNLVHNTEVEIGYKINNMYDQNNMVDTEEIFTTKTKLLTLQYVSHEAHVHSLIVNWQCRVEGENYDKDPISGFNIVFVNHGYIIETTEDKEIHHHFGEFAYRSDTDGNAVVTTGSGSYTTKKWTYTGLESGRIYTCCATVTDGRNSVSNWAHGRYNIKTLNNMVRIWDSHTRTWRRGIPYIYHNRKWMDCSTTHLYHNGKWWECDPERIRR